MTNEEKLALKKQVEDNPHLFSARRNRDYETMASVLNEGRAADAKLTPLQLHECMDAVAPEPDPPA